MLGELLHVVTGVPPTRWLPLLAAQVPRLRGTIEASDPASVVEPAEVEADLLAGIAALDDFGAVPDRVRAQATLGAWLTRQGRSAEAAPYLAAARGTFEQLRAATLLRDLDAALFLSATG